MITAPCSLWKSKRTRCKIGNYIRLSVWSVWYSCRD
jgi:hypothetical protein